MVWFGRVSPLAEVRFLTVDDILALTFTASQISYDNGTSGLAATDVQAALDELASTPAVSSFLALTDTPDSYSGKKSWSVFVNITEDGVEFRSPLNLRSFWGAN